MSFISRFARQAILAAALSTIGASGIAAQTYEVGPSLETCSDASYDKSREAGIVIGIAEAPPYSSIDPKTGEATGIDVEINKAVLDWMQVKNVRYEVMPFNSIIPSLLSKRIDMIGTNIHVTPDREKVITFSGPVWWYGPAIVVKAGNPLGIKGFDDLKEKKVGVILGSAADEYIRKIGAQAEPFQAHAEEFASLLQGRVDALLEDDAEFINFKSKNPDAPLEMVAGVVLPEDLLKQGYGYARYGFRKEDCSLRAMYSQGIAEMRGAGAVSTVLKEHGYGDRNLFVFPVGE